MADDTFVAAAPELANRLVGNRADWRRWWPDLQLDVVEDRGAVGVRWQVAGPIVGTMEIWCEAMLDGFVLHYFLHGEPTVDLPADPRAAAEALAELNRVRRVAGKVMAFEIKDRLEGGREPGAPAVAAAEWAGR